VLIIIDSDDGSRGVIHASTDKSQARRLLTALEKLEVNGSR
jgi:hypothetical protein